MLARRRLGKRRGLWLIAALVGGLATPGCNGSSSNGSNSTSSGRGSSNGSSGSSSALDPLPLTQGKSLHAPPSGHAGVLRIVDWNIAAARDAPLMDVANTLQALDADVIALQEVDLHTQRTDGIDEAAQLAQALDYNYAFAAAIPWEGGYYGIATLSRFSFTSVERIQLSNANATEARTALDTLLCPDGACIHVVNHHADLVPLAAELSTDEVLAHIQGQPRTRVALLADLNQIPTDAGPQACLKQGLVDLGAKFGAAPTEGDRRIDYAFVDAALVPCAQQLAVMDAGSESDHRLLLLDLDLACVKAAP